MSYYILLYLLLLLFLLNEISRSFGTYCLLNLSLAFLELQGEPEDIQRESTNGCISGTSLFLNSNCSHIEIYIQ